MNRPTLLPPDMDDQIEARCARLPEYTRDALIDYLRYGLPPGSFLTAVLSNDLYEAVKRADDDNRRALADFVIILANYVPIDAWGSPDDVQAWIERGATVRAGTIMEFAVSPVAARADGRA